MDKVRIKDTGSGYSVTVNGRAIATRGYEVSRDKDNFAMITLYADADVVLAEEGDIDWVAMPKTVNEAIEVLATAVASGEISNHDMALALGAKTNELLREKENGNG